MTSKTIKTILFAALIVAMVIPTTGMQTAAFGASDDKKQKVTDDPVMYDYLKDLMQSGKYVKEKKTNDGKDAKSTNTVEKLGNKKYQVNAVFEYEGEIVNDQTLILTKNSDGSINMINEAQGFNVDFYKSDKTTLTGFLNSLLPEAFAGSGNSNGSGGNIFLYDVEYGTPGTLYLSDGYSGCYPLTQGEFEATVSSTVVDVTWQAHPFYWHWCVQPHQFDNGSADSEGSAYNFGMSERTGFHSFSHSGGTNYYSATVEFNYGSW